MTDIVNSFKFASCTKDHVTKLQYYIKNKSGNYPII